MNQTTLVGRRYGRLRVVDLVGRSAAGEPDLLCQCDCGSTPKVIAYGALRCGSTKSCGCLRREVASSGVNQTTHGHSSRGQRSPTYTTWTSMRDRCGRPKHPAYPRYGGRGILVCPRWSKFENFLEDMGERPPGRYASGYPLYTLDRIDPNGNYEPGNCRWATMTEQRANYGT